MSYTFERWLDQVKDALHSTNMRMEHWQDLIPFDFGAEFRSGTEPEDAALKAARYRRHANMIAVTAARRAETNFD